jgi:hypothetical protein
MPETCGIKIDEGLSAMKNRQMPETCGIKIDEGLRE